MLVRMLLLRMQWRMLLRMQWRMLLRMQWRMQIHRVLCTKGVVETDGIDEPDDVGDVRFGVGEVYLVDVLVKHPFAAFDKRHLGDGENVVENVDGFDGMVEHQLVRLNHGRQQGVGQGRFHVGLVGVVQDRRHQGKPRHDKQLAKHPRALPVPVQIVGLNGQFHQYVGNDGVVVVDLEGAFDGPSHHLVQVGQVFHLDVLLGHKLRYHRRGMDDLLDQLEVVEAATLPEGVELDSVHALNAAVQAGAVFLLVRGLGVLDGIVGVAAHLQGLEIELGNKPGHHFGVHAVADEAAGAGTGDGDVKQPPLLVDGVFAGGKVHVRHANDEHIVPFQPFAGMDGRQRHRHALPAVVVFGNKVVRHVGVDQLLLDFVQRPVDAGQDDNRRVLGCIVPQQPCDGRHDRVDFLVKGVVVGDGNDGAAGRRNVRRIDPIIIFVVRHHVWNAGAHAREDVIRHRNDGTRGPVVDVQRYPLDGLVGKVPLEIADVLAGAVPERIDVLGLVAHHHDLRGMFVQFHDD